MGELIVNLTLCTANERSCTGMSAKEWKKENFLKLVKIWPRSRKTTKKLESKQLGVKAKMMDSVMNFKKNLPKNTERDTSARTLFVGIIFSSVTVVEKYTKHIS